MLEVGVRLACPEMEDMGGSTDSICSWCSLLEVMMIWELESKYWKVHLGQSYLQTTLLIDGAGRRLGAKHRARDVVRDQENQKE